MNVTFSPYINHEQTLNHDTLTWNASWIQYCSWDNLPEKFKTLGNMNENLASLGVQNLQVWRTIADQLRLQLHDDFTYKKVWVDHVPWKVVLVANGEDKTHIDKEIQLSNSNTKMLCYLLEIENSGIMNPIDLLKKIEQLKNKGNLSGFYENLLSLEHLCDHCIKHNCDISWK